MALKVSKVRKGNLGTIPNSKFNPSVFAMFVLATTQFKLLEAVGEFRHFQDPEIQKSDSISLYSYQK